ncbi:MAG: enoyl-CoA hydratase/isomerase family protein [Pseudonocardia sp.]|nr:enoyl-CoA hydratase/isomerase family protein [Pseudonocardia sp.]
MTTTGERTVDVRHAGAVATVVLDRADRLNALDLPTRRTLIGTLRGIAADPAVRAVVLTGTGRAFCVGQDLAATDELEHADETGTWCASSATPSPSPSPRPAGHWPRPRCSGWGCSTRSSRSPSWPSGPPPSPPSWPPGQHRRSR